MLARRNYLAAGLILLLLGVVVNYWATAAREPDLRLDPTPDNHAAWPLDKHFVWKFTWLRERRHAGAATGLVAPRMLAAPC